MSGEAEGTTVAEDLAHVVRDIEADEAKQTAIAEASAAEAAHARAVAASFGERMARGVQRCPECNCVGGQHALIYQSAPHPLDLAGIERRAGERADAAAGIRPAVASATPSVADMKATAVAERHAADIAKLQDQLNNMGLMLAQNRHALLAKRDELAAHETNYDAWEKQHVVAMRKTQEEITSLQARAEAANGRAS